MFENLNLGEIIFGTGGYISAIASYFVGKRKANAESESIEIAALKEVIAEQRSQIQFLNDRIKDLQCEITECRTEIKELKQ